MSQSQIKPKYLPQYKGNYIDQQFTIPDDSNAEIVSKCPGNFMDEIGRFACSYASVDEAVASARQAFKSWKKTSVSQRAEYLKKYQSALKAREEELIETIAREVGKPLWESKTEFSAMLNKVDITIQESMRLVEDFEIPKVMEGTLGACRFRPLGVMVVIGPFNFPGHLPNGHIVPALMTGNTVVFKPSEKAPMVGQIMAECLHAAGLPPGVFNLIQGEKEVGRRLCVHEHVDGVLFTGSYEVGTRIKQDTLQQHWKLLALEMGGKNTSVIFGDADLDVALHETLVSAFVTAGQRCSATSRVLVERSRYDEFVSKFHQRSKAFTIGHPLQNPFMGPLIDSGSVDRYLKFLGIAEREGCEILMRGKALDVGFKGNYVAPSICLSPHANLEAVKKSIYQQSELFAPNVVIMAFDQAEEAVALANATQYGLVCSVYSGARAQYDQIRDDLEFGLINWNKSTVGASSRLPFGGLKKSGNHRPTALFASQYCTVPVASLEVSELKPVNSSAYPGLNWE